MDHIKALGMVLLFLFVLALTVGAITLAVWLLVNHTWVWIGIFVGAFLIFVYQSALKEVRSWK